MHSWQTVGAVSSVSFVSPASRGGTAYRETSSTITSTVEVVTPAMRWR